MIIDKNIEEHIIFYEDSIINALSKIDNNKHQFVIAVDQSARLEGILTDGDFRRWLLQQNAVDLSQSVENVINKNCSYALYNEGLEKIQKKFSFKVDFIPLVDENKHLVAVARRREASLKVGNFLIDDNSPALIVAEIGNNHNGSLALAKQLIDQAQQAGANCVKFQLRNLTKLYRNQGDANDASADLGEQYTLDLLNRFQLTLDEMYAAFDYCKDNGILSLCTPFDIESLQALEEYGMQAYKVASADLTNHNFLKALAKTGSPLICSTGMSTESEIVEAIRLLKYSGAQYVLLQCNSTYPAPFKDINLNYMMHLKKIGACQVGYSGHERGINVAIAAISIGAKVIEKHFTLDRNMEGNDHKVSLIPKEFQEMVTGIREVEQALGTSDPRQITQGESMNREILGKSLVINRELKSGEIIVKEMIDVRSPGRGLAPNRMLELIGTKAKRDYKEGEFFFPSDIEEKVVGARTFSFKHLFGVPVRYHDFQKIFPLSNFDLIEFHLSYKDLQVNLEDFFEGSMDVEYVVHCPELFKGDHVLDLCSLNDEYRKHSIKEVQNVIEITRKLNVYFPKTKTPKIVVNVGGFTQDKHLKVTERLKYYQRLLDSLDILNTEQVELLPQTMPPLPWHFGGQRYHNLFVDPDEILSYCEDNGFRVCLDVSHSKLACNYYKYSFKEFIEKVAPYTAHLHIADAKGIDSEGLQINEGEIDFIALAEYLNQFAPDASFITEVWQGHKNEGEGFWISLERLEAIL